ncbi:DUF1002 domain-containing protein [Eubacterium oxidoreducens]|uniref:Uncharacterized protein YpuA, DUF1002 family n=1 Tax=Eubacterium oxidoreducens TaxID=1732 RepID=A0A1G6C048_EUBOX|nr:DUF1002 domain-containing protein [Eubacterium oxidoreducens]SDB26205.1 Uncharacterized protein YpuA, DUF1002 family [Eubacterium oxidoreducens]
MSNLRCNLIFKKMAAVTLTAAMCAGAAMPAMASSTDEDTSSEETTDEDTVVVEEDDEPYLALGEDLTSSQKSTVLELMGIEEEDLDEYNISYVSNEEEYEYLSSYIDSSKIGSNALSSVVVMQGDDGDGINVTTKNISYCTEGMYQNALATAGIENADVIVVGPTSISGTAALVGIFKAYEAMTGEEIDEDSVDTAINEMVITGELEDSVSDDDVDSDTVEGLIAYVKQKVASGELDTDEEVDAAIDEACEKFDVTLTDDEKQQIKDLMEKINALNLDPDQLSSAVSGIMDNISDIIGETDLSSSEAKNIFTKIISGISEFFSNLFS